MRKTTAMTTKRAFRRNLFEVFNARNLSVEDLVGTFVPTQSFWRLLSAENHVLLGSRGSGKTAVAKMLSHDHLSRLKDPRTQEMVTADAYIGMYVPTRLTWVGGLRNKPWQTRGEKELFFQWRLNVATCLALLDTVASCLRQHVRIAGERARLERRFCGEVSTYWVDTGDKYLTLAELERYLRNIEYRRQQQIARLRSTNTPMTAEEPVGVTFEMDLFEPLRAGIQRASEVLNLPKDAAWLLCLDEAEFLDIDHHRILNSHMRAFSENLFMKVTTKPYCHYTLETTTPQMLDPGHDFEYIYLDSDPDFTERAAGEQHHMGTRFARDLFERRAEVSGEPYASADVDPLVGRSALLDPREEDWDPDTANWRYLKKYASDATIKRAERLRGSRSFMFSVGRKIHGALLLRHDAAKGRGNTASTAYSGATMMMRCGDGNPRRLVRIFNQILLKAAPKLRKGQRGSDDRPIVSRSEQTRLLGSFARNELLPARSEPPFGDDLYELIQQIGQYMREHLHGRKLTTDQVSSVSTRLDIEDAIWDRVKCAVGLGLLYPNVNPKNPDELPVRKGTFHLAYALAPEFQILPRRGRSVALSTILERAIPGKRRSGRRRAMLISSQRVLLPEDKGGEQ